MEDNKDYEYDEYDEDYGGVRANNIMKVLHILESYSSREHPMTYSAIIDKMDELYGHRISRNTVHSAMQTIKHFKKRNDYIKKSMIPSKRGFFIDGNVGDAAKRMIIDTVYSFPFLSVKDSEHIISSLDYNDDKTKRKPKSKSRLNFYSEEFKNKKVDKSILENIEKIYNAIDYVWPDNAEGKKITFEYHRHRFDSCLTSYCDKCYTVSPIYMVYLNRRYYLIALKDGEKKVKQFRVDKIRNIDEIDEKSESPETRVQFADYFSGSVYGFSGDYTNIAFKCRQELIDIIVDEFGKNFRIYNCGNDMFRIDMKVSKLGFKVFALRHIDSVEVISPESLRNDIIEKIKSNCYGV